MNRGVCALIKHLLTLSTNERANAVDGRPCRKAKRAVSVWHPDKFRQRYGAKLRSGEKERIMTRVEEVAKEIIVLRQTMIK